MNHIQKAGISLNIVVVGGSIAGLATAYTLARAGHSVLILEKSDGTARGAGGVQSPPNMTRILNEWGLKSRLDEISQQCEGVQMFAGLTGELLGIVLMKEEFLKDLVAEFLFVLHSDLHKLLHSVAVQEGVKIRYHATVTNADGATGRITLSSGEELYADLIVGADGYTSLLQDIVAGPAEFRSAQLKNAPSKSLIVTHTVPAHLLEADPDLRPLVADPSIWSTWLGHRYIAHANSLNSNQGHHYTVTVAHDYDGPIEEKQWGQDDNVHRYGIDFVNLEIRAIKLVSLTTENSSRLYRNKPPLESLVCDYSRIVLVGEAARPVLPGGNHNTALAIEDAQTLGCLLSRIQDISHVSRMLTAYDEIRQPRSAFVHQYTIERQRMFRFPPGPEQEERDDRMRQTLARNENDHINEANFKDPQMWGVELDLFAHNASEMVEDWWGQWGYMISGRDVKSQSFQFNHRHSLEISVRQVTSEPVTSGVA
ncbi:hypothetical protein D9619_010399 [Psilocybe cf. subviscida]|uniref:FAD-binding domain-containing protein n=1 Tax=Psilocybe cf. subviscida TaxID=2480587 RepID=A0A8H5ERZ0_9AGAR|nr:hypothetical protein D9619_010399 [Psilocybe cf. subviscida]